MLLFNEHLDILFVTTRTKMNRLIFMPDLIAYFLIFWFYSFHTQTFAYPESSAEREEILLGLQGRIEDIKSVRVIHEDNDTV